MWWNLLWFLTSLQSGGKTIAGWTVVGRPNGDQLLTLHIFVAHGPQSKAELQRRLWASSDPSSPHYGEHVTFEEMNALLRPPAEATSALRVWLEDSGVHWDSQVTTNPAGDIIEVTLPVSNAERLLQAEYLALTAAQRTTPILRTGRYTLPATVARYIDTVGPTTRIPLRAMKVASSSASPSEYTTPASLRERYGATGVASTSTKNSFALCGFLDQYIDPKDMDYFYKTYDKQSVGKKVAIKGPNTPGESGMEATVDVCYGAAMAAGVATTFWSTAGRMPGHSDNEPLLQWLSDLSKDPAPPLVFSFSYSDDEDTVDLDYAQRVNVELQKAGARGLSIVESSGDGGVAGIAPKAYCPKGFMATFPATSPYVTSVGGTGGPAGAETASTHYPSGGGFSTYNWQPRPSFQKSAVDKYLETASLPSKSNYNSSNRGYPDVSLASEDYALTQYSISINVDGTSCSAPVFGSLVALLNDARLSKGLPSLGWLNPLLYAHPEAFTDITKGSNPACGTGGFPAAPGWDPVTGLGTMKFKAWQNIVQNIPTAALLV